MLNTKNATPQAPLFQLSSSGTKDIEKQIDFEIMKTHHRMLKLGAMANIVGGALYVFLFIKQNTIIEQRYIYFWYLILVVTNILNILWAVRFETNVTMESLQIWRKLCLFFLAVICLTWGSIGIFFVFGDIQEQLITLAFLLAVLIAFSFATFIDFTLAVISITCLIVPTLSYRTFIGIYNQIVYGHDISASFGVSASFTVLGIFMLAACYLGSHLVRKYFRISFENVLLVTTLKNANKILDQRVQERTNDLENSLKLVQFQATHDILTDLPNRQFLLEYLIKTLALAKRHGHIFAIMFIDLDKFKNINDTFGHDVGDELLRVVTSRLNKSFRVSDFISRTGGDEFIVVLTDIKSPQETAIAADKFLKNISQPIMISNQSMRIGASIGIVTYPSDGNDITELMKNADSAMYTAKHAGGNRYHFY